MDNGSPVAGEVERCLKDLARRRFDDLSDLTFTRARLALLLYSYSSSLSLLTKDNPRKKA